MAYLYLINRNSYSKHGYGPQKRHIALEIQDFVADLDNMRLRLLSTDWICKAYIYTKEQLPPNTEIWERYINPDDAFRIQTMYTNNSDLE